MEDFQNHMHLWGYLLCSRKQSCVAFDRAFRFGHSSPSSVIAMSSQEVLGVCKVISYASATSDLATACCLSILTMKAKQMNESLHTCRAAKSQSICPRGPILDIAKEISVCCPSYQVARCHAVRELLFGAGQMPAACTPGKGRCARAQKALESDLQHLEQAAMASYHKSEAYALALTVSHKPFDHNRTCGHKDNECPLTGCCPAGTWSVARHESAIIQSSVCMDCPPGKWLRFRAANVS